MMPSKSFGKVGMVVLMAFAAMACTKSTATSGDDTAGPGEDSAQTEANTEALATLHVSSTGSALTAASMPRVDGNIHAEGIGAALSGSLIPAGCMTETTDVAQSQNTYVYDDCTGPWGLVHLTGTIVVKYSSSGAGQLTLDFSASSFKINAATLTTWTATANITASGSQYTMLWQASLAGITGSGRDFARTNDKTITWTTGTVPACVSISGTSQGTVTGHDLKTTVTDYQRCAAECPQAGSEIAIQNLDNGKEVDVKYNGGPSATVSETVNGKTASIDLPLACGL
jgi:hypothetical protein